MDNLNQNLMDKLQEEYYKKAIDQNFFVQQKLLEAQIAEQAKKQQEFFQSQLEAMKEQVASQREESRAASERKKELYKSQLKEEEGPGVKDYQATEHMLAGPLIEGLKKSQAIFQKFAQTPEYLAKMQDNLRLTPEEAQELMGVRQLVKEELQRLTDYKTTNSGFLNPPKGKQSKFGEYAESHIANERAFLGAVDKALETVDSRNPVLKYTPFMTMLAEGIPLFEKAQNNPVIQNHPEGKILTGTIADPDEFQKIYSYIDSAVKAHGNWIWVPQAKMFIPKDRYDSLKNMAGYIQEGNKITEITPEAKPGILGQGSSDWEFLASLPSNRRKEFMAALGQPVQDPRTRVSAALRNMLVYTALDPAYRSKVLKVLPYWMGNNGYSTKDIVSFTRENVGYNELHTGAQNPKSAVEEMIKDRENLSKMQESPEGFLKGLVPKIPPSSRLGKALLYPKKTRKSIEEGLSSALPMFVVFKEGPQLLSNFWDYLSQPQESLYGTRTQQGLTSGRIRQR